MFSNTFLKLVNYNYKLLSVEYKILNGPNISL